MNKIKNHKKIIIALFIMCVIVLAVVFFNWTSHSKKEVNTEEKTVEKVEVQNNSLDQKIIDVQKLLDEKVKNKEHISNEDKAKLENIEKSLSEFISKKDEIKINELYEELQKIVIVEAGKKEESSTNTTQANETTEKVTETKPAVKPTTQPTVQPTTPKVEEKKKTCRIVRTPAKYKVIEQPEKFRMEPIYEQRECFLIRMNKDGKQYKFELPNPTGESFQKFKLEKEREGYTYAGHSNGCNYSVKVGEIKIVEQEAWTEEIEISPAKEETICE